MVEPCLIQVAIDISCAGASWQRDVITPERAAIACYFIKCMQCTGIMRQMGAAPSHSVHGNAAIVMPEQCAVDGILVHSPRPSYSHLQLTAASSPQMRCSLQYIHRASVTAH